MILFPAAHPVSRCAPVNVARLSDAESFLDGVDIANRIGIGEVYLDGRNLVGTCDDGADVAVVAHVDDPRSSVSEITVSCSACGTGPVCRHGVAALLTAHGYAGVAHRLVADEPPGF
jgi:hypothetical protein